MIVNKKQIEATVKTGIDSHDNNVNWQFSVNYLY